MCLSPPAPGTTPEAPDLSETNTYEVYSNKTNEFTRIVMVTELDSLLVLVSACSDAYIILHESPGQVAEADNSYHIVLGTDNNQKSEIRKKGESPETQTFDTPNLLRCLPAAEMLHLSWREGTITLRRGSEQGQVVFTWQDSNMYDVNAVALGSRHDQMAKWTFQRAQGINKSLEKYLIPTRDLHPTGYL